MHSHLTHGLGCVLVAGVPWLVARSVRVTVLTNSLAATDSGAVNSGCQRYREALHDGGAVFCEGVPLAEDIAAAIERNLDSIAWRLECVADASGIVHIEWVEANAEGERQYVADPEVSVMRRFSVWFLGLLPIESQL